MLTPDLVLPWERDLLVQDWQAKNAALDKAADELARHQAEVGCADFDAALDAVNAALSVERVPPEEEK